MHCSIDSTNSPDTTVALENESARISPTGKYTEMADRVAKGKGCQISKLLEKREEDLQ